MIDSPEAPDSLYLTGEMQKKRVMLPQRWGPERVSSFGRLWTQKRNGNSVCTAARARLAALRWRVILSLVN